MLVLSCYEMCVYMCVYSLIAAHSTLSYGITLLLSASTLTVNNIPYNQRPHTSYITTLTSYLISKMNDWEAYCFQ